MERIKYLFVVLSLGISVLCNGQKGCLVGNVIYPNLSYTLFVPIYSTAGGMPTVAPNCPRAKTMIKVGECKVGGLLFGTEGDEYTYVVLTAPVGCPIDDYAFIGLLLIGGVGFLYIRNKTRFIS